MAEESLSADGDVPDNVEKSGMFEWERRTIARIRAISSRESKSFVIKSSHPISRESTLSTILSSLDSIKIGILQAL